MRILLTNRELVNYAGTEMVVCDLALAFLRQGHDPMVFSPRLGAVAEELAAKGVPVISDVTKVTQAPDVIHGQHHAQALEALARFSSVPGIYVCHDAAAPVDEPFYFPRLLRYVAVDERCRARIEGVAEIPRERIETMWNAVDLERFQPRGPLPAKPRRALVFSNYANWRTHLPAVRRACRRTGVEVDVLGKAARKENPKPELVLPRYDIVFAKARCALEAMAVGCAVVLCDFAGVGPMVTSAEFDGLRHLNFGRGTLVNPLGEGLIRKQIERYDAADAARVAERVRSEAGLAESARLWIDLYSRVIEEFRRMPPDPVAEVRALAAYAKRWSYERRVQWEDDQISRLERIPMIGGLLARAAWVGRNSLRQQKE